MAEFEDVLEDQIEELEGVKKLEFEAQLLETKIKSELIKDKLIEIIKTAEEQGGAEKEQIIMQIRDASPEVINQEIQKFIEEGIVFEPRPGKVRYLG